MRAVGRWFRRLYRRVYHDPAPDPARASKPCPTCAGPARLHCADTQCGWWRCPSCHIYGDDNRMAASPH